MIKIPIERLENDLLRAIAESFVLREGTDYGANEYDLDKKVSQVLLQVKRGEIVITFDESTETCNLMTRQEWVACQKTLAQNL